MIAEGVISRTPRGSVNRDAALASYGRFLRSADRRLAQTAEATRWQEAKTRKLELELKLLDARLMATNEAVAVTSEVINIFRDAMTKSLSDFDDRPDIREKMIAIYDRLDAKARQIAAAHFDSIQNKLR